MEYEVTRNSDGSFLFHGEGPMRPIAAEGETEAVARMRWMDIYGRQYEEQEMKSQYLVRYNPKPIPDRSHDWDWVHKDYDGPEDNRCGTAASHEEAWKQIQEESFDD